MIPDKIKNNELDRLLRDVLESHDDLMIPSGLGEKTIRKLKKKAILRELLLELSYKTGLVLGSLGILAGVLLLTGAQGVLLALYRYLSGTWVLVLPLLFVAMITIFIDQIGLRFYEQFRQTSDVTNVH